MTIAEAVRHLRGAESRQFFASRLGLSVSAIQNYEQKGRTPDAQSLLVFSREATARGESEALAALTEALSHKTAVPPAARWPGEFGALTILSDFEWIFMAAAQRLARDYMPSDYARAFLQSAEPIFAELITENALAKNTYERVLNEMKQFADGDEKAAKEFVRVFSAVDDPANNNASAALITNSTNSTSSADKKRSGRKDGRHNNATR